MIAKIAVSAAPFAIDKPYSYRIPKDLRLVPGVRVMVPFGKGNRRSEGVVLSVEEGNEDELKTVELCLDEEPLLSDNMLRLAAFLRERCFCTFYEAVRVMFPAGGLFKINSSYHLTEDRSWENKKLRQLDARKVLELLRDCGGETNDAALRLLLPEEEKRLAALKYLINKKWIETESNVSLLNRDKSEKLVSLKITSEELQTQAANSRRYSEGQRKVLDLLSSLEQVPVKSVCYMTGVGRDCINRLVKVGVLEESERKVLRISEIRPAKLDGPLVLNDEQQAVFEKLASQMEEPKPGTALLYGVTGSGKTSVYLKLIQSCLDSGKSALLLVPEIALTPQLLSLLAAHFGSLVAVQHSSLSAGERYDQWKRIRANDARVIVGTRSAVFAPSSQLGVIIIDEEQEHSYRSENNPRYDAREVALWRGWKENCLVLLGSATPSVETMYRARSGDYRLYSLTRRYNGKPLPEVSIVDMRQQLKNGNDSIYSEELLDGIIDTKSAGKQTILLLNRRGNSRALVCVDCGEAPECPRCSARLTYHSANGRLMCHHCSYSQPTAQRCPRCGGPLKPIGIGTQKAQLELESFLPDTPIQRMDTDTVNAVNTHEVILDRFQKERIPVLIGTQMVAKGLNLPDVTLVGVLDADMSLYCGGWRSAETTFNMLTQVIGRAGRGDSDGRAVIQTMVPEHKVLTLAARQDYDGFYELELQLRKLQNCPPFGDFAGITFLGQDEGQVLRGAAKFRDSLNACLKQSVYATENCHVLGPAPCVVPKINYNYRYRLTLRCKMSRNLRFLVAHLLRQFLKDSANKGVSAFVDVNGMDE